MLSVAVYPGGIGHRSKNIESFILVENVSVGLIAIFLHGLTYRLPLPQHNWLAIYILICDFLLYIEA
jgi:hypothetical protein